MKKILIIIAIMAGIFAPSLRAQTFGSPVTWSGNTNSGYFVTNSYYLFVPSKSVFLTSTNNSTNEVFTATVWGVFPGNVNYAVQTNVALMSTNFTMFSTNTPGSTYPFNVVLFMSASNGPATGGVGVNFTNQIYVP